MIHNSNKPRTSSQTIPLTHYLPYNLSTLSIKAATLNVYFVRNTYDNIVNMFHDLKLDFLCLTKNLAIKKWHPHYIFP